MDTGHDNTGSDSDGQPGWPMVGGSDIDGDRTDSVRHRVHTDSPAHRWPRKFEVEMTTLEIIGAVTIAWWTIKLIIPGL